MTKQHYDTTLKVGDIVRAYKPGYHRITKIEEREARYITPLIHYKPLLNGKGGKARNEEDSCDAAYCIKASEPIKGEIAALEAHIAKLKAFQKEHDL